MIPKSGYRSSERSCSGGNSGQEQEMDDRVNILLVDDQPAKLLSYAFDLFFKRFGR